MRGGIKQGIRQHTIPNRPAGGARLILVGGMLTLLACSDPGVEWVKDPPPMPEDTYCVVSGEPSKPKYTVKYKGKYYYLCCKKCIRAFKANPERYADD